MLTTPTSRRHIAEADPVAMNGRQATTSGAAGRRAGLRFAITAALCGLLGGCENSVSYTPVIHPSRPLSPRSVDSVEVFAVTPPSRPHKDIGILQVAQGNGDQGTPDGMVADARATAAQLGCDAILVTSIDVLGGRYHRSNIQASCIVYDAAAPLPPPPANQSPPPPTP